MCVCVCVCVDTVCVDVCVFRCGALRVVNVHMRQRGWMRRELMVVQYGGKGGPGGYCRQRGIGTRQGHRAR